MTQDTPQNSFNNKRVFAAADAILRGVNSLRGVDTQVAIYDGLLRPHQELPAGVFTFDELFEAVTTLTRMELLPTQHVARTAQAPKASKRSTRLHRLIPSKGV